MPEIRDPKVRRESRGKSLGNKVLRDKVRDKGQGRTRKGCGN